MTTKSRACKHPDDKVLWQRKSCGCKTIKCYLCSMEATLSCKGHGAEMRLTKRGRK